MEKSENSATTEYIRTEKAALRLIARAEQCSNGLTLKLEKRGFDPSCINEVITKLTEQNLLDDSRFARFWLQSRIRFAKSPRRLLSSLCARGIELEDAQAALKNVLNEDDAEFIMLTKFVNKYGNKAGDDQRALKYLLKNEGFSSAAIKRYFGE